MKKKTGRRVCVGVWVRRNKGDETTGMQVIRHGFKTTVAEGQRVRTDGEQGRRRKAQNGLQVGLFDGEEKTWANNDDSC